MSDPNPAPQLIERFRAVVSYLKNEEDSQAGFLSVIRKQESDLEIFGAHFAALLEENRKLHEALELPMPRFRVNATVESNPRLSETVLILTYDLEKRFFKMAVSNQVAAAWRYDAKTRRRLRWRTYMDMCRTIRAMLDKALREAKL